MIIQALTISLTIVGIYTTMLPGMIFSGIRIRGRRFMNAFVLWAWVYTPREGRSMYVRRKTIRVSQYWQKPLFSCVICMSSVWTILLSWSFNIQLIFLVCGINAIIARFFRLVNNSKR